MLYNWNLWNGDKYVCLSVAFELDRFTSYKTSPEDGETEVTESEKMWWLRA